LKGATNFSLWKWNSTESKVAEEYCWAVTQAVGRACCGHSRYSVLESSFQLNSLLHKCNWPYGYSIHSCKKFDLHPTFRNITIVYKLERVCTLYVRIHKHYTSICLTFLKKAVNKCRANKMHPIPLVYFYCDAVTYMFRPVIRPSSWWHFSYQQTVWSNVSNCPTVLKFIWLLVRIFCKIIVWNDIK